MMPSVRPTRTPLRAALAAGLALLGSGCATLPHDGARSRLSQPYSVRREVQALSAAGLSRRDAWPAPRWWRAFRDPQLDRIVAEGLAGNPTLKVAAARLRLAESQAALARAATLPSLDAQGEIDRQRLSDNGLIPPPFAGAALTTGQLALNASYDLDWWGKNRAALRAALSEARAARAESAAARLLLSTAVVGAYVSLQADGERLDVAKHAAADRKALALLVDARVDHGLEDVSAFDEAAAARERAHAQVIAAQAAVALDRQRLGVLIGKGPDAGAGIAMPRLSLPAALTVPERLPLELLARRPDLAAQRARVEAAAQRIHVARAGFYPDINLAAMVGQQSFTLGQLLAPSSRMGSIGIAVDLPIFDGGRLRAVLHARNAEYDAAVETYNELLLTAAGEVAHALTRLQAVAREGRAQRAAEAKAKQAYGLARVRYTHGLSSYLDVLQAEQELLAAHEAVVAVREAELHARVELVQALGGGFVASGRRPATGPTRGSHARQ
ncbi:MAG: efflux transporter outer membrane subunit [Betaproteobacteria bacterium]|nr:efflux transporter outer membrane subunit [Betaproteobacteria bacterium]